MKDLGTLGGESSFGAAINNSGQVTGWADPGERAFLWTPSEGMMSLPTLGGSVSAGFGINSNGQVTGNSCLSDPCRIAHAFRTMTNAAGSPAIEDLGTLGGSYSSGYAINANGQVTGVSLLNTSPNEYIQRAFLYSGSGPMQNLGTLPDGEESFGLGINDSGQVTGWSDTGSLPDHKAFLYCGGVMTNLNDLIDPASGWSLNEATDINNQGQIVGRGANGAGNQAFLLTPNGVAPAVIAPSEASITAMSASITAGSARLGGDVTSDGGAEIAERGVVYSITTVNGNPVIGRANFFL